MLFGMYTYFLSQKFICYIFLYRDFTCIKSFLFLKNKLVIGNSCLWKLYEITVEGSGSDFINLTILHV